MKRRIALIAVMICSVLTLAVCNQDKGLTEYRTTPNATPDASADGKSRDAYTELTEYKSVAKATLNAHADSKGRINYTIENWTAILEILADGMSEIEAAENMAGVDSAVWTAKDAIDGVSAKEVEVSDFALTISAEKTTLPQGEDFKINVELKNQSGEDRYIAFSLLFWPSIPGWNFLDPDIAIDPPEPQLILLKNNASLKNIGFWGSEVECWTIGGNLDPGVHELRFAARFSLIDKRDNEQRVEILSNTVVLTVQ